MAAAADDQAMYPPTSSHHAKAALVKAAAPAEKKRPPRLRDEWSCSSEERSSPSASATSSSSGVSGNDPFDVFGLSGEAPVHSASGLQVAPSVRHERSAHERNLSLPDPAEMEKWKKEETAWDYFTSDSSRATSPSFGDGRTPPSENEGTGKPGKPDPEQPKKSKSKRKKEGRRRKKRDRQHSEPVQSSCNPSSAAAATHHAQSRSQDYTAALAAKQPPRVNNSNSRFGDDPGRSLTYMEALARIGAEAGDACGVRADNIHLVRARQRHGANLDDAPASIQMQAAAATAHAGRARAASVGATSVRGAASARRQQQQQQRKQDEQQHARSRSVVAASADFSMATAQDAHKAVSESASLRVSRWKSAKYEAHEMMQPVRPTIVVPKKQQQRAGAGGDHHGRGASHSITGFGAKRLLIDALPLMKKGTRMIKLGRNRRRQTRVVHLTRDQSALYWLSGLLQASAQYVRIHDIDAVIPDTTVSQHGCSFALRFLKSRKATYGRDALHLIAPTRTDHHLWCEGLKHLVRCAKNGSNLADIMDVRVEMEQRVELKTPDRKMQAAQRQRRQRRAMTARQEQPSKRKVEQPQPQHAQLPNPSILGDSRGGPPSAARNSNIEKRGQKSSTTETSR